MSLTLPAMPSVEGRLASVQSLLSHHPSVNQGTGRGQPCGQVSQGHQIPHKSAMASAVQVMHGQMAYDLVSPDEHFPPGAIYKGPELKTWIQE